MLDRWKEKGNKRVELTVLFTAAACPFNVVTFDDDESDVVMYFRNEFVLSFGDSCALVDGTVDENISFQAEGCWVGFVGEAKRDGLVPTATFDQTDEFVAVFWEIIVNGFSISDDDRFGLWNSDDGHDDSIFDVHSDGE